MNPEQLKLAFALDLAQRLIDSDGEVDPSEFALWGRIFPCPLLRQLGLVGDDDTYTDTFHRAREQAAEALADELEDEEKLDLLLLLYGTAQSDGHVDPEQVAILSEAAARLGLPAQTLTDAIREREDDLS